MTYTKIPRGKEPEYADKFYGFLGRNGYYLSEEEREHLLLFIMEIVQEQSSKYAISKLYEIYQAVFMEDSKARELVEDELNNLRCPKDDKDNRGDAK